MATESSIIVKHSDQSQWLNGRAASIGSSDGPGLLGHGYAASSSWYALWAEKSKGLSPERTAETLRMFEKGKLAEPYIAGLCRLERGWDIQFDPDYSYRRNIKLPYLTASLDAWMTEEGEPVVLEFKNLSGWMGRHWDSKSGKAPLKNSIQVQHQLAVTGWSKGYLVGLHGFDIHVVPVKRHDGLISAMLEEYSQFWAYVVGGVEPPIDDSDATHEALKRVYPVVPMDAAHLDERASGLVAEMLTLEQSIESDSRALERCRNRLVQEAEGAEFLVTSGGQWFSFKSNRGGKRKLKPHNGKVRVG